MKKRVFISLALMSVGFWGDEAFRHFLEGKWAHAKKQPPRRRA